MGLIIFIVNAAAVILWILVLSKLGGRGIRQANNTTVLPVFLMAGIVAAIAALVIEIVIGSIAPR